jgi:hypothetical protein
MKRRRGQIRRNHVLRAGHEPQRQYNPMPPFAGCRVAPLVELLSPRTQASPPRLALSWGCGEACTTTAECRRSCRQELCQPLRPPPSSTSRRGPAGSQSQSSRYFSRHPPQSLNTTPHHTPPQHNMSEQLQVSITLPSIVFPHYGIVHSYKSCRCKPPASQPSHSSRTLY